MALEGNWNLNMVTPMGDRPVTAEFTTDGTTLGGQFTGAQGAAPLAGTIDGNAAAWKATVAGPMGQMELSFKGTVDGDKISGEVAFGAFGSGAFTGSKA